MVRVNYQQNRQFYDKLTENISLYLCKWGIHHWKVQEKKLYECSPVLLGMLLTSANTHYPYLFEYIFRYICSYTLIYFSKYIGYIDIHSTINQLIDISIYSFQFAIPRRTRLYNWPKRYWALSQLHKLKSCYLLNIFVTQACHVHKFQDTALRLRLKCL